MAELVDAGLGDRAATALLDTHWCRCENIRYYGRPLERESSGFHDEQEATWLK